MNATTTDVPTRKLKSTDGRLAPRRRKVLPSDRPAHAAASPADQPRPRVPHNVACPVCKVSIGTHCKHTGPGIHGGPSYSHPERRLLAGKARREQVYGVTLSPALVGWAGGIELVKDSLAEHPDWARR